LEARSGKSKQAIEKVLQLRLCTGTIPLRAFAALRLRGRDPMLLSAKDAEGQRTTSVRLMRTLGQLLAGIGALFKPHSLR
jgi:hypothetical protein